MIVAPHRSQNALRHPRSNKSSGGFRVPVKKTKKSMAFTSRELPIPNVPRITSLGQAHATLLHCWNKLWKPDPAPSSCASFAEKRGFYAEERKQLRGCQYSVANCSRALADLTSRARTMGTRIHRVLGSSDAIDGRGGAHAMPRTESQPSHLPYHGVRRRR
jgi:hypothetical protein